MSNDTVFKWRDEPTRGRAAIKKRLTLGLRRASRDAGLYVTTIGLVTHEENFVASTFTMKTRAIR